MSFSDLLTGELGKVRPQCSVCKWYSDLTDQDRKEFDAAFDVYRESQPYGFKAAMFRAAKKMGLPSGDDSFSNHLSEHYGLRGQSE